MVPSVQEAWRHEAVYSRVGSRLPPTVLWKNGGSGLMFLRPRSSVSCALARLRSPFYCLTRVTRVGGRRDPTRLSTAVGARHMKCRLRVAANGAPQWARKAVTRVTGFSA